MPPTIYYNESRTHRSLNKDAPLHRAIQRLGAITSQPVLGGLHHRYCSNFRYTQEEKLAKSATKSKTRKGASKAKRRKAGGKVSARAQASPVHEEDHIDGCDVEFHDGEATPDAALPAARGGVEVRGRRRA